MFLTSLLHFHAGLVLVALTDFKIKFCLNVLPVCAVPCHACMPCVICVIRSRSTCLVNLSMGTVTSDLCIHFEGGSLTPLNSGC